MSDAMLSQEEIDELLERSDADISNGYEQQTESIYEKRINSDEYIKSKLMWFKNNIREVEQTRIRLEAYLLNKNTEYSKEQIKNFANGELITVVSSFVV